MPIKESLRKAQKKYKKKVAVVRLYFIKGKDDKYIEKLRGRLGTTEYIRRLIDKAGE